MFAFIYVGRQLAALAALALGAAAVSAQSLELSILPESSRVAAAGEVGEIRIALSLDAPWYVYAPTGANARQGLVETTVTIRPHRAIQFARPRYPEARAYGTHDIWRGRDNVIRQPFRIRPRTPPGDYRVRGHVDYQMCDGPTCLPPDRKNFSFLIHVSDD